MLVSLPTLHQGHLRQESSSSKLVRMYHQQQAATDFWNVGVVGRPKKLTRSVTPRRLPPLNLDPSISSGSVSPSTSSIQATSPKISPTKPHSLTDHQQGNRAQSEVQLQFERQHAFEVSLEQMLMEVENGTDCEKEEKQKKSENRRETKKEEKQKKVGKEAKNKEKSSPAWRKIWYKRQG